MTRFPGVPAPVTVIPRHRGVSLADGISLVRLPLAVAFVVFDSMMIRVGILLLAGVSDMGDGWVARRRGGSNVGEVLDPITDKIFLTTAFGVVLVAGSLTWYEVAAVLVRDLVATVAYLLTGLRGRTTAVPARLGGKVVTAMQLVTVVLCLAGSAFRVQFAWLTAGAALYAIYDYSIPFFRKLGAK